MKSEQRQGPYLGLRVRRGNRPRRLWRMVLNVVGAEPREDVLEVVYRPGLETAERKDRLRRMEIAMCALGQFHISVRIACDPDRIWCGECTSEQVRAGVEASGGQLEGDAAVWLLALGKVSDGVVANLTLAMRPAHLFGADGAECEIVLRLHEPHGSSLTRLDAAAIAIQAFGGDVPSWLERQVGTVAIFGLANLRARRGIKQDPIAVVIEEVPAS